MIGLLSNVEIPGGISTFGVYGYTVIGYNHGISYQGTTVPEIFRVTFL